MYVDPLSPFHKPMRNSEEIQPFPDSVPFDDDGGVIHYSKGLDANEKFQPSELQDFPKQKTTRCTIYNVRPGLPKNES